MPLIGGGSGGAMQAIADRCEDPKTIGGVVISYYSGYATHYYLLWQSETTTFDLVATLVKCNGPQRGVSGELSPNATSTASAQSTIVGVIDALPGSGETPWVVRRTQISIPLLTFASLTTLLTPKTSGKTTNLTVVALAGSLFSNANSKDIPGYSDPIRLRAASKHIADDIFSAGLTLCRTTYDIAPDQYAQREEYCKALGIPTSSPTSSSLSGTK